MPRNEEDEWWRLSASCRGMVFEEDSFDTFFPTYEHDRGPVANRVSPKATLVCSDCPVKAECLDYALRNHISDGTWGGLSPGQRTVLHRRYNASEEKLFADLERDFEGVLKG